MYDSEHNIVHQDSRGIENDVKKRRYPEQGTWTWVTLKMTLEPILSTPHIRRIRFFF